MTNLANSAPAVPPGWERVAPLDLIEHFNERAGLAEYEGGASRPEAEEIAAALIDQTYMVFQRMRPQPKPKKDERDLSSLERLGIFLH